MTNRSLADCVMSFRLEPTRTSSTKSTNRHGSLGGGATDIEKDDVRRKSGKAGNSRATTSEAKRRMMKSQDGSLNGSPELGTNFGEL